MLVNDRNIKMWSTIGSRATFGVSALELAKKISIPVNRLNIRQFNDYYLWSINIINNDIINNN